MGNLRTGWISFQLAKAFNEPWVVRFEDIDKIRVIPGADRQQLDDMAALGCVPDEIVYQSQREDRHWELFARAIRENKVYPCFCSAKGVRQALQGIASAANSGDPAPVYTGHCRNLTEPQKHSFPSVGWRFRSVDPSGRGDFLVARSGPRAELGHIPDRDEFVPSYHWACGIDDLDGRYSVVVRAWDLEPAAVIQREIQSWVDGTRLQPAVFHTALVLTDEGGRLEKRTQGVTLEELAQQGVTPAQLRNAFSRSFVAPSLRLAPGALSGEDRREVRLSELLSYADFL